MINLKIGDEPAMSAFAFIVAIVQTLTWPVTIVIIVYLLRDRLRDALSRLAEVSFPGGSVKFGEKLEELKATSNEVIASQRAEIPLAPDIPLTNGESSDRRKIAVTFPEAAVVDAYRDVESAVRDAARSVDIFVDRENIMSVVGKLNGREVIGSDLLIYFRELRELRNQAAHSSASKITSQQAIDYIDQCNVFTSALTSAVRRYKNQHNAP
jgi:hypothetical protein